MLTLGQHHYYCRIIAPDLQIICQIDDYTDPNA